MYWLSEIVFPNENILKMTVCQCSIIAICCSAMTAVREDYCLICRSEMTIVDYESPQVMYVHLQIIVTDRDAWFMVRTPL